MNSQCATRILCRNIVSIDWCPLIDARGWVCDDEINYRGGRSCQ